MAAAIGANAQVVQTAITEVAQRLQRVNNPHSHKEYMSTLSRKDLFLTKAYIVGCGMTGFGIGGAIGSAACPGPGTVAGVVIGTTAGVVVGVVTARHFRLSNDYERWAGNQKIEIVSDLYSKFKESAEAQGEAFTCPLSGNCPPLDPVKTPYTNDIYERSEIEKWIKKDGHCPMTRKPLKIEDLRVSVCSLAHVSRVCREIINKDEANSNLSAVQQEGLKLLQKDFDKNLLSLFKAESEHLMQQVLDGKLDYAQYAFFMRGFAEAAQPSKTAQPKLLEQKGDN